MKQKKLVELFAVIVILALVATPIILNVINDAKKEAKDSTFTYENDTKKQEDKKLTQTKSETTEDTENYKFYENGTAIYYNPETGKKCESSEVEIPSKTGTKSGCMKWYVFNDKKGNATVNVILDHNTTASVKYNSTVNNSEMKEVANALKTDTSNWKSDLNPRLITANEVAKITGNTNFDASKTGQSSFYLDSNNQTQTASSTNKSTYAWLFDYTSECTWYGCNKADSSTYGYWTSTPKKDDSTSAWRVYWEGLLDHGYVDSAASGIRPVITISKSNIS